jgi:hypothetical protein
MKRLSGTGRILKGLALLVALGGSLCVNAGSAGSVKFVGGDDAFEVNTAGEVEVTDGTGGYTVGTGIGVGRVAASFSSPGTHPVSFSRIPSLSPLDSGVAVTYQPPSGATGEEEITATALCTVVLLRIIDFGGYAYRDRTTGTYHAAVRTIGVAMPAGLGSVSLYSFSSSPPWTPFYHLSSPSPILFNKVHKYRSTVRPASGDLDFEATVLYARIRKRSRTTLIKLYL